VATAEHDDVVVIGSGAGGGTLAWKLAPSGKRILLLERGGYLPRERDNWDTTAVFLQGKYSTNEEWRDRKGDDWDYPFGAIQMLGKSDGIQLRAMAPRRVKWGAKLTPEASLDTIALHGVDFWLSAEDLPRPDNRLPIDDDGTPRLALADENNAEPLRRLRKRFQSMLTDLGMEEGTHRRNVYLHEGLAISATGHQAGTARFGTDPTSSVLDTNCKAHELDNLYVVDLSFFVSTGAVNPTLTIIANALRVGEHLLERLG
jgi:choline dehydrogenase-like flavoprotein